MRLCFAAYLLMISTCAMALAVGQSQTQKETEESQEWAQLVQRVREPRSNNLITSGMWTLTHAGELKDEVEAVMNLYQEKIYLTGDFHPLVEEEVVKIGKRCSDSFLKMKAQRER